MALRFRRTIKIAPGVRINVTKTGVSARVGPRGAGVTVGTSGTTVSAGIPGAGLHVSEKVSSKRRRTKAAPPERPVTLPDAAEPASNVLAVAIVLAIFAAIIWGLVALFS